MTTYPALIAPPHPSLSAKRRRRKHFKTAQQCLLPPKRPSLSAKKRRRKHFETVRKPFPQDVLCFPKNEPENFAQYLRKINTDEFKRLKGEPWFTNTHLRQICENSPDFTDIDLYSCNKITGLGLRNFMKKMKNLEYLHLPSTWTPPPNSPSKQMLEYSPKLWKIFVSNKKGIKYSLVNLKIILEFLSLSASNKDVGNTRIDKRTFTKYLVQIVTNPKYDKSTQNTARIAISLIRGAQNYPCKLTAQNIPPNGALFFLNIQNHAAYLYLKPQNGKIIGTILERSHNFSYELGPMESKDFQELDALNAKHLHREFFKEIEKLSFVKRKAQELSLQTKAGNCTVKSIFRLLFHLSENKKSYFDLKKALFKEMYKDIDAYTDISAKRETAIKFLWKIHQKSKKSTSEYGNHSDLDQFIDLEGFKKDYLDFLGNTTKNFVELLNLRTQIRTIVEQSRMFSHKSRCILLDALKSCELEILFCPLTQTSVH